MINLTVTPDPDHGCLKLAGDLTIYTIAEAKAEVQLVTDSALDLSDISEFDGAGLQLLMALCRDGNNQVLAASEAVMSVLELTGQNGLVNSFHPSES